MATVVERPRLEPHVSDAACAAARRGSVATSSSRGSPPRSPRCVRRFGCAWSLIGFSSRRYRCARGLLAVGRRGHGDGFLSVDRAQAGGAALRCAPGVAARAPVPRLRRQPADLGRLDDTRTASWAELGARCSPARWTRPADRRSTCGSTNISRVHRCNRALGVAGRCWPCRCYCRLLAVPATLLFGVERLTGTDE